MAFIPRDDGSIFGRWWWTVDRWSIVALLILIGMGIVMAFAASPAIANRLGADQFHLANRHLMYVAVALVAMFVCSFLTIPWIKRLSVLGMATVLILLVATLLLGEEYQGGKRWISFGFVDLQPSELAKPMFVICSAWLFALDRNTRLRWPLVVQLVLLGVIASLLLAQPDVGQTAVIFAIWGAQFFLAGYSLLWVTAAGLLVVSGLAFVVWLKPHALDRVMRFWDQTAGDTYQVTQSLKAFIEGGLFGKGPGEGVIKALVPDVHADFVFAAMGEEFGMIACVLVVAIFALIITRGLLRLSGQSNLFIVLSGAGFLTQFGFQAIVNMSTALNLMPTKGMTLPFISYGGSSMLGMALTMGLLLAVSRRRPKCGSLL